MIGQPKWLTESQVAAATSLWQSGATASAVCDAINISRDVLNARRGDQLKHLADRPRGAGPKVRALDEKDAAQIIARREAIKAAWSPEERLDRKTGGHRIDSWVGERLGRAAERVAADTTWGVPERRQPRRQPGR